MFSTTRTPKQPTFYPEESNGDAEQVLLNKHADTIYLRFKFNLFLKQLYSILLQCANLHNFSFCFQLKDDAVSFFYHL